MRCATLWLGMSWQVVLLVGTCFAQEAKKSDVIEAEKLPPAAAIQAAEPVPRILPPQAVQGFQAIPMMRMAPAMPVRLSSGLPFDLGNLVLAKYDDAPKGPQIIALMEQTRMEKRTVTITKFQQEIRTRKVTVTGVDGKQKQVDQEYTVSVPVSQDIEREVSVPVGKKPTALPFDTLKVHRLDGSKVTAKEAKTLLEKTTPVFLLKGYTGEIKAVEGVYLQAINPNCLIVVTEPDPAALPPAPRIIDDPFAE